MQVDLIQNALILIVDDSQDNLRLLSDFLSASGFAVDVAKSGREALSRLGESSPDLILLDVMMPGMDGFETCVHLQSNPVTRNVPIIFMSALASTLDKVRGLALGAVDYVTKPLELTEVLARIQLHLKLRVLSRAVEQQNQLLEKRVEDRTRQLSQTLRELEMANRELLRREERLRYEAMHDPLTGLPNRLWLGERLQMAIRQSKEQSGFIYALLFLDLDRFKNINDSLGHLVGDALLKSVADRLTSCLPKFGRVTRFGGDEFVILLEALSDAAIATTIAQQLVDQFRQPFIVPLPTAWRMPEVMLGNDNLAKTYEVFTGASVGVALGSLNYNVPEEVLRDADIAMHHAKLAGKGRYKLFTSMMQLQALERWQLENDMRRALETQEFVLYYQPIVDLAQGRLLSFEALVRWQHPVQGLISPTVFIPIAEETGMIQSLGWWVLCQACQQLQQWRQQFPHHTSLVVSVNFSPMQFKQLNLLKRFQQVCEEYQISRYGLKLEITESSLLEALEWQGELWPSLQQLGITLCIDDFGTGHSSFSRLQDFPIDTLKIDRAFVSRIGEHPDSSEIVRTIVSLAHSLNMNVVAEGIETLEQLAYLKFLNCEAGQGYLFSLPVSAERAAEILAQPEFFQKCP